MTKTDTSGIDGTTERKKVIRGPIKLKNWPKEKENYYDEGIQPECKCKWKEEDPNCCEYVCRPWCR